MYILLLWYVVKLLLHYTVYATLKDTNVTLEGMTTELEPVASDWRPLGVKFGFSESQLDAIENDHPHGDVMQCLRSMLDRKMKQSTGLKWSDIVLALGKIGLGVSAEAIEKKYCKMVADSTGHGWFSSIKVL